MSRFGLRYHYCSEEKQRIKFFTTEEARNEEFEKIYQESKKRNKRVHFLIKI